VPEGWEVVRVGSCLKVRNDLRRPINQAARELIRGPYSYYGPTRAIDSINEYRLEGTFALIGEDGDHFLKFDRWSMTQLVSGRFNVNNHAHVLEGTATCSAEWFAAYFRHRDITPDLTRQGATRYKLKKETLLSLPMALPPVDEQRQICRSFDAIEVRLSAESAGRRGLEVVKAALLAVLLSGEVRVTANDDGQRSGMG